MKRGFLSAKDIVVCSLKRYSKGKAIPSSAHIEPLFEEIIDPDEWNHLNEIALPGNPGVFWINRGYEVYSIICENYWFQYCFSDKDIKFKEKDLSDYRSEFIPYVEHEMCAEKSCYAYMTFDDCEHTLPESLHYLVQDYI